MRVLRTYPALASVYIPANAVLVSALERPSDHQAPTLVFECDYGDDAAVIKRSFVVLHVGATIPPNARHIATWRRHSADGGLSCLYERLETDVPADLDPERHADYRLLAERGFTQAGNRGGERHAWTAPDDYDHMRPEMDVVQAIVRLQEHGYGPIVGA